MSRFSKIFLIWIFPILFQINLLAQEEISVTSSVDKSRMTIGDLIQYSVTVTHDPGIRVDMPSLGANLGEFQIRDYQVEDPAKSKGKILSTVEYTISTFFTGEFEIPPLTVTYFTPGDSTAKSLQTESIQITVESVKTDEAGDIRDIKPPVEYPARWWTWGKWAVIGGCVLLAAAFSYILYRRKKAGKSLLPIREEPPRPPHEIALEALDRLKSSGLLNQGKIKQYYIEVSEIIRHYIEGRYYIIALEMTTYDVLNSLSRVEITDEDFELIRSFLEQCDLVKFAKLIPGEKENHHILDMAYEIVHRTKVVLAEIVPETEENVVMVPAGELSSDGRDEMLTIQNHKNPQGEKP